MSLRRYVGRPRRVGWMGSVAAVLLTATAVMAADAVNTDRTGLAIGGYDPVAYHTTGRATKGNFQITAEHGGAVYRFVSEENREKFTAAPAKYAPRYGGYCAFGVSLGKKFSADPEVWRIVEGRLYLNLDRDIASKFNEDLRGNIAKAEKNWPSLAEKPAR